jgi:hypothetical protein
MIMRRAPEGPTELARTTTCALCGGHIEAHTPVYSVLDEGGSRRERRYSHTGCMPTPTGQSAPKEDTRPSRPRPPTRILPNAASASASPGAVNHPLLLRTSAVASPLRRMEACARCGLVMSSRALAYEVDGGSERRFAHPGCSASPSPQAPGDIRCTSTDTPTNRFIGTLREARQLQKREGRGVAALPCRATTTSVTARKAGLCPVCLKRYRTGDALFVARLTDSRRKSAAQLVHEWCSRPRSATRRSL